MLKRILSILFALGVPAGAMAAISLLGPGATYAPSEIQAGLNFVINAINTQAPTCTTTGCAGGQASAAPAITGVCATAGSGTGFALADGANSFAGHFTCGSSVNTQAIITWAVARNAVPTCTFSGTTGAIVTATSTTTVLTLNYASVASNVISYICVGL